MTDGPAELEFLRTEDLLEIAAGVLDVVEVRDLGLLASAAGRPQTTVFGDDAYPTFAEKEAALMHSLARNHPLVDGNKRLAWAGTRVFCLLNGRDLRFSVDEAEQLVLAVATGALDVPDLAHRLDVGLGAVAEADQAIRPSGSVDTRQLGAAEKLYLHIRDAITASLMSIPEHRRSLLELVEVSVETDEEDPRMKMIGLAADVGRDRGEVGRANGKWMSASFEFPRLTVLMEKTTDPTGAALWTELMAHEGWDALHWEDDVLFDAHDVLMDLIANACAAVHTDDLETAVGRTILFLVLSSVPGDSLVDLSKTANPGGVPEAAMKALRSLEIPMH